MSSGETKGALDSERSRERRCHFDSSIPEWWGTVLLSRWAGWGFEIIQSEDFSEDNLQGLSRSRVVQR